MTRRLRTAALGLVLAATVALGACSSDDTADQAATTTTSPVAAPSTTAPAETTTTVGPEGDPVAFCAAFDELAAARDPDDPGALDLGDGSPEAVAAAYAGQTATVEKIAAAAPAEMVDNAETYLDVIAVRAQAAAQSGANSLAAMDPADRDAFIAAHGAQQGEINELLAYAHDTCGDL